MDFRFSDDQEDLRGLARQIFERETSKERAREAERGDGFDRALWSTLAEAQLLGVAIPEAQGGSGFGLIELALLLREAGRQVAPIPAHAALVLGALPLASFGSEAQKARWLPPIARGELLLGAALQEPGSDDPALPQTRARSDGDAFVLDGEKNRIPAAHLADALWVPALLEERDAPDGEVAVFRVDPRAEGVTLETSRLSNGETLGRMGLAGVRVAAADRLDGAGQGAAIARSMEQSALLGLCALQLGVCERAIEITSAYAGEREQFGTPIGTFQAVQHRAADAYIDLECLRWTTWSAAWRLAQGRDAEREVRVAKFWASEGGARITAATQHLHAGLGVDLDYPIHRYFLWSKQLELALGGATPQLARLGREMAESGASAT